jgi:nucleoside-diphosphate-sugar epimerase
MVSQLLSEPVIKCGFLDPQRDYTFVKDTVAGFISAAVSPGIEGMTINVGTGKKIAMGDLLQRIMSRMDVRKQILSEEGRLRPAKSEVMALICDNTRARAFLGWEPGYTLDEGLDEVVSFVKSNTNRYKTDHFVV